MRFAFVEIPKGILYILYNIVPYPTVLWVPYEFDSSLSFITNSIPHRTYPYLPEHNLGKYLRLFCLAPLRG